MIAKSTVNCQHKKSKTPKYTAPLLDPASISNMLTNLFQLSKGSANPSPPLPWSKTNSIWIFDFSHQNMTFVSKSEFIWCLATEAADIKEVAIQKLLQESSANSRFANFSKPWFSNLDVCSEIYQIDVGASKALWGLQRNPFSRVKLKPFFGCKIGWVKLNLFLSGFS